jgi:hypothetical protein
MREQSFIQYPLYPFDESREDMPEIQLRYRGPIVGTTGAEEFVALKGLLQKECANRFLISNKIAAPSEFSFVDDTVTGMSSLSHSVVIRVTLDRSETNIRQAARNAAELAAEVHKFLNSEKMVKWCGRRSVGLALSFTEIAWASVGAE